jgi:hypothetical protein
MQGTLTRTVADSVTIHTYTAPEQGWRVNSHPRFLRRSGV